jgi:BirA family transcriptional regulator, biotin operon repressor / biotin---[acetyl-CoA-carboxylase] ligase
MIVNQKYNTRDKVLKVLFDAKGETVSGVLLSEILGISRVAIWKHISALKEAGFSIESRARGYALLNPDDLLLPFCFGSEFENRIFHFQELESTMDKAKVLARGCAPHLSLVIAENQSAGRGRLKRQWFSSRGGLWFTLILKPEIPPLLSYIYIFAASLSLSETLEQEFGLNIRVKWPNDLLLDGKKLAGLLSEMETSGNLADFINIGIGLNVNNQIGRLERQAEHQAERQSKLGAISLKDALGRSVSRALIMKAFLKSFQQRIQLVDCNNIIALWKERTSTIGSHVRVETFGEVYEGLAMDVDETGALLIRENSGQIRKIIYGDCFHT